MVSTITVALRSFTLFVQMMFLSELLFVTFIKLLLKILFTTGHWDFKTKIGKIASEKVQFNNTRFLLGQKTIC